MATDKNEDVFSNLEALTKPRDEAWSNWKSWKDSKVGDKVQGYIRDAFYRSEEGQYDAQRGITIEQKDGTLINVGIKRLPFILDKTDEMRVGDPIIMELSEQKPAQTKGFSPTNIFKFYGKKLTENDGNPTVKQLDDEDRAKGGSGGPEEEPEETQADKDYNEVSGDTKDAAEQVPFEG